MAFVKLDCGILNSTIWVDREARELFITALLMASPFEAREPLSQYEVRTLEKTGFTVPIGWYGFVPSAGVGIIRQCGMDQKIGMDALERLGAPEAESRTPDFEGRRLVRVDGGYLLLNYDKYRQKDHTAAERQARFRAKKSEEKRYGVTPASNGVTARNITHSEAESEADTKKRERKKFSAPSLAEVQELATSKKVPESSAEDFIDHHQARGWIMSNGKMMVCWKSAFNTWIKRSSEFRKYGNSQSNLNLTRTEIKAAANDREGLASPVIRV